MGMNDQGQICGQYQDLQGNIHGFIKSGSNYTTVDVPGADQTWCIAMNNHGDVVGVYYVFDPNNFQEHGYILHKSQFLTFPTPGLGALTGINDQGVVAGCYTDGDGPWHGFIATPHGNVNGQP